MKVRNKMMVGAAVAVLVVAFAGPAVATDSDDGWYTWATTNTSEPTNTTVDWPQTYVGEGQLAPECGVWYQQDNYLYPGQGVTVADVIADGVLTNGEDHHLTTEWRFVYGGDCVDPEPTPTPTPLECPEGTVPGWLDGNGEPQGCVGDEPNPGAPSPEPEPEFTDIGEPADPTPEKRVAEPAVPVVAEPAFTG